MIIFAENRQRMSDFTIEQVYQKYSALSHVQRKQLLIQLRSSGIPLKKIEAFTYSEAPGIKHLFFYFDNAGEGIPYFMLDTEIWLKIRNTIMSF